MPVFNGLAAPRNSNKLNDGSKSVMQSSDRVLSWQWVKPSTGCDILGMSCTLHLRMLFESQFSMEHVISFQSSTVKFNNVCYINVTLQLYIVKANQWLLDTFVKQTIMYKSELYERHI